MLVMLGMLWLLDSLSRIGSCIALELLVLMAVNVLCSLWALNILLLGLNRLSHLLIVVRLCRVRIVEIFILLI